LQEPGRFLCADSRLTDPVVSVKCPRKEATRICGSLLLSRAMALKKPAAKKKPLAMHFEEVPLEVVKAIKTPVTRPPTARVPGKGRP